MLIGRNLVEEITKLKSETGVINLGYVTAPSS
jgi:hypothetical protein